jgi:hypothetical protein
VHVFSNKLGAHPTAHTLEARGTHSLTEFIKPGDTDPDMNDDVVLPAGQSYFSLWNQSHIRVDAHIMRPFNMNVHHIFLALSRSKRRLLDRSPQWHYGAE